jgi:hypothetical protein
MHMATGSKGEGYAVTPSLQQFVNLHVILGASSNIVVKALCHKPEGHRFKTQ